MTAKDEIREALDASINLIGKSVISRTMPKAQELNYKSLTILDDCIIIRKSDVPEGVGESVRGHQEFGDGGVVGKWLKAAQLISEAKDE